MHEVAFIRAALGAAQLFGCWPARVLDELAARVQMLMVPAGQIVVPQGDLVTCAYVIVEGRIEVSSTSEHGRTHIRRYANASSAFGLLPLIDGRPSPYTYLAKEDSKLACVPKSVFFETIEKEPSLWRFVVMHFSDYQRMLIAEIDASRFEPLPTRLAHALLLLAREPVVGSTSRSEPCVTLTQEELARLFSVSRQTISKELKHFENARLIAIDYRCIRLLDTAALRRETVSQVD